MKPGAARLSATVVGRMVCSFIVFHAPHEGQRPVHLGESYPHSVHTYAVFSFAISSNLGHKISAKRVKLQVYLLFILAYTIFAPSNDYKSI
jgi:hypothetical protein